ncbi:hypothetical protein [Paenibacillus senegalensis]|uniref:hypothetical protein n=1 Tax=Paenibacillus senegalensis TaxID=1465766 RepID=UPI000288ED00|nr:hypothetical protein [Paenibacillus senegalensis]
MDQLTLFLQERWYIVVIGLVVLFLAIKLIRTVVKWVIVLALIAVIVIYAANYTEELGAWASTIQDNVTAEVKEQAVQAMRQETEEAKYKANSDGSFTITTKNLLVEVPPGSLNAEVTYLGQSFTIPIDSMVQGFIDQAMKASNKD